MMEKEVWCLRTGTVAGKVGVCVSSEIKAYKRIIIHFI